MEETEFEAFKVPEAPFSFYPFRRSHLRSATYCTLVRIFSHCDDDAELCQVIGPVQRSKMDGGSFGDDSILNKDFCEATKVMQELAQTMIIETNENVEVDDNCLGIGLPDKFIDEETSKQELDDTVKGDEIHGLDYMKTSCSLKQIHGGNINIVCPVEEHPICQQVVEESWNTEKITNFVKCSQDTRISTECSSIRKFPEVKQKEMDFEMVVCSTKNEKGIHADAFKVSQVEEEEKRGQYVSNATVFILDENLTGRTLDKCENHFCEETMISPNDEVESDDVEEGEIFGDFAINDELDEIPSVNFEVLQKKVDDFPMAADNMDGSVFASTHAFGESASNGTELKDGQYDENIVTLHPRIGVQEKLMIGKKIHENDLGMVEGRKQKDCRGTVNYEETYLDNLVVQSQISMTNKTGSISTQKKKDHDVSGKKKPKPNPSKGRKEKKKKNKRKRRAEKDRELGVKRLKIHPVITQKPVTHCRHYLKGRCQEGEKCKFSHDAVPLTKSKPCCHFARHSCMKGDDCPYDHQLSKYPCANFIEKGSCIRGAACMFSHKKPPLKEESKSTSNPVAELKSSSLVISDPKKQLDSPGISKEKPNFLSKYLGSHFLKDTIQNATQNRQEETPQKPVGINFLSFGNTSSCHSNSLRPCSSSLKVNDAGSNDLIITKSPMLPKGMSFLSFNKAPVDLSSDISCGGKLVQQDVEEPKGKSLTSFGKSYPNDYHAQRLDSSSSKSRNGLESTSMDVSNSPDKIQNLSLTSSRLLQTPISSGQPSAESFTSRIYKGTTNSAQKALLSTFAFAAKYESLLKVNQPVDSSAANSVFGRGQ